MDWVDQILACITCLVLGAGVCWIVMKRERDEMEKQIDGMMSTINAYRYNLSSSAQCHSPANHAYYEDDSEVGSRVWMDHVTEPFVLDAAEALGLFQEGDADEIEIVDGSGAIVYTYKSR